MASGFCQWGMQTGSARFIHGWLCDIFHKVATRLSGERYMSEITLTVDGMQVSVPAGATVMQAADKAGIRVPRLCYHPRLSMEGACRVCLVDVEGQPGDGYLPSLSACCSPLVSVFSCRWRGRYLNPSQHPIGPSTAATYLRNSCAPTLNKRGGLRYNGPVAPTTGTLRRPEPRILMKMRLAQFAPQSTRQGRSLLPTLACPRPLSHRTPAYLVANQITVISHRGACDTARPISDG